MTLPLIKMTLECDDGNEWIKYYALWCDLEFVCEKREWKWVVIRGTVGFKHHRHHHSSTRALPTLNVIRVNNFNLCLYFVRKKFDILFRKRVESPWIDNPLMKLINKSSLIVHLLRKLLYHSERHASGCFMEMSREILSQNLCRSLAHN